MITIIAGSRSITNMDALETAISICPWDITQVVCGMAPGADELGYKWAVSNGIPIKEFPANWLEYGRKAGPLRNIEMAKNAHALIALWDGKSTGTKHMIDIAKAKGLYVLVTDGKPIPLP